MNRTELASRVLDLPADEQIIAVRALAAIYGGNAAPGSLREFVSRVNPRFQWYRHCEVVAGVLERVARGELRRMMIFAPPRHGKSELVSRLFPAYYLAQHPERWCGLASYAAELAFTLSRQARAYYQGWGRSLRDDAAAVKHWETGQGGGLWAAGVGGPATGKGAHLGIIDDPIKNAEDAASEVIREKQWEWWQSVFYTRLEPEAAVVMVLTRWNELDLAGRILDELASEDAGPDAEPWHVVHLPAIAEDKPPELPKLCSVTPEWRSPGEPLCAERYPLERLRKIERRVGPYFWAALFGQRPRPREGNFFKWAWFPIVEQAPAQARRVRYWDTAGTEGAGDFTVGALMSRTAEGVFYVEDVVRGQWSPARRDQEIVATAKRDRETGRAAAIWLEQEAGVGGKERTLSTIKALAGFEVHAETVTGSKADRAEPLASQAEVGNVRLVRGPWNHAFLTTLCSFPTGAHDDDVDAAAGGMNKLLLVGQPATIRLRRG